MLALSLPQTLTMNPAPHRPGPLARARGLLRRQARAGQLAHALDRGLRADACGVRSDLAAQGARDGRLPAKRRGDQAGHRREGSPRPPVTVHHTPVNATRADLVGRTVAGRGPRRDAPAESLAWRRLSSAATKSR